MHAVSRPIHAALLLVLAAALAACTVTPQRAVAPSSSVSPLPAHDNLHATLWMQSSAEYVATTVQVFRQACDALDTALADPQWNALPLEEQGAAAGAAPRPPADAGARGFEHGFEARPPAVIADLDETLIDNSPYQARRILAGGGFTPETWAEWVNEARARAVPGALEFAHCARARGVTLVYVSNRKHDGEREQTVANLRTLGFPLAGDGSELVLLRGDTRAPGRDKGARRRWVAERYRVVQLLGDNLGDFLDAVDASPAARSALVEPYADWWGRRWFMLPNPSYGSWEDALLHGCATPEDAVACKRAALRLQ